MLRTLHAHQLKTHSAGKMTVNTRFGTKVAVLAGDFLFAQSSWYLANLDNLEVGMPCFRIEFGLQG